MGKLGEGGRGGGVAGEESIACSPSCVVLCVKRFHWRFLADVREDWEGESYTFEER